MDLSDCQGLATATNSPDTTSFTFKCDVGPQEAVHHKVSSAEISSTKSSMNQSPNNSVKTDVDLLPKARSESPTANDVSLNPEVLGSRSKGTSKVWSVDWSPGAEVAPSYGLEFSSGVPLEKRTFLCISTKSEVDNQLRNDITSRGFRLF
ncbi:hypothetical protein PHET_11594 [Paragonimus heterotremus]|uniref:Uncharacterized protein n=1 Tax=Paragonimus heterotremus TaxID=100268 RepID=A0A8J4WCG0_9TREM|nr:hypothetical protein PHET_11594 [Paragonimus heterotremus]